MNSKIILIIIAVIVVICICCSIVAIGAAGLFIFNSSGTNPISDSIQPIPDFQTPFDQNQPDNTIPVPVIPSEEFLNTPDPMQMEAARETLDTLQNTLVPNNDPRELAVRLQGVRDMPDTVPDHTGYNVGDEKQFWATNVDTNVNRKVTAQLAYITDHVYFWIEKGVSYNERDLANLVETFENDIYPTDREFFGTEWSPGIDDNVRLFLLYATDLGSNLAGYFSSADSVPPEAQEYSNAHEMFMLNADNISLDEKFTYGVLAHEFQHMIHWYRDRNETSWLNEGFSELAAFLNGYYESGFDYLAMSDPDIQLTDWPNNPNSTTPHYGASFLFLNYFLNRFGEDATKAVVADPDNGMDSIDGVLEQINAVDPLTDQPIKADDVFADWAVTNLVLDDRVSDGRFSYQNYSQAPQASATESITNCDTGWNDRVVSQYGVDYIQLNCGRTFTLSFQGTSDVGVLPIDAYSGDYAFWSNKGDESDMTLTQTFDFSAVTGSIDLSFQTWYDLETDYDYLYLEASLDGQSWEILQTPSCTTEDPSGNSFGCGYNDITNGWMQETVDLSAYAGEIVQLRFEYITDAAVNGEGFLLDDVSIPQINYFSDFETDAGGWQSEGWVRIQNSLPQTYQISLVDERSKTEITRIELNADQKFEINLDGSQSDHFYLVVSGTTRFTRQPAYYRFSVIPSPQ